LRKTQLNLLVSLAKGQGLDKMRDLPSRAERGPYLFMIGLVLVSHGQLATEFRSAMEHVVGHQQQLAVVCIGPEDDMDARRGEIVAAIDTVDSGDGVVVLTDMFGGTPSNLAISAMNGTHVEVIAGINLPMLVKLAKVRGSSPLAEAVVQAQDAGRKYINVASHILAGR
jgi:PTS system mannose-specific IIA component